MSAAAYVGRVGGLGIALGVGIAVASGCGVAWADGTGSSAASDTTSSSTADGQQTQASADAGVGGAKAPLPSSPTGVTVPRPPSLTNPSRAHRNSPNAKPPAPAASKRRTAAPPPASATVTSTGNSDSRQAAAPQPSIKSAVQTQPAVAAPTAEAVASAVVKVQPVAAAVDTSVSKTTQTVPNVVSVALAAFGLDPLAANSPLAPAGSPTLWGLLAWARREFETMVSRLRSAALGSVPTQAISTAPLQAQTVAAAAVATGPTTTPVAWVTGSGTTGPYLLSRTNNTAAMFGIAGTDLGIMWDNGIVDNPATPVNEHQVLMAFGDTFSGTGQTGIWRSNTLLRSSDQVLADGISVAPGQVGNVFSGSPLSSPNFSKQIINSPGYIGPLGSEVTIIPTSGVSVPYNNTYGSRQYVSFMSVKSWDTPGRWTTNYSAIAYSDDNGQTWTVAPSSIRSAASYRTTTGYISGNQNFQQSAFVRPPAGSADAGYVYAFGTPSGRGGTVYLSRVQQANILDQTKYEYWNGTSWVANKPSAATPILPATTTASTGLLGWFSSLFGGSKKTYPSAGEMSVQYNTYLSKYVMMYADNNNNVVMRTADRPEGPWSGPTTLVTSTQYPGLYAPMMDPWSTGQDIYWNMSMWGDYNVLLMHTKLA